jgi:hypothetical protein
MSVKFAEQLREFIDDRDVDQVLRCLDGLKQQISAQPPSAVNFPLYFIAYELVCVFGPVKLSVDQLLRLREHLQFLLQSVGKREEYPDFPGMAVKGVSILHALSVFTAEDALRAESFFTAMKRAGIVTRTLLRARCEPSDSLALHLAAETGNAQAANDIVKVDKEQLIITNGSGATAADVAEAAGHAALAKSLRSKEMALRQSKQVGNAIKDLKTDPVSEPTTQGTAVNNMMNTLIGYNQLQRGALVDEREMAMHEELRKLKLLIKNICEPVPGAPFFADLYFKMLVRRGITKPADVKKAFQEDRLFAAKFPSWMRLALFESLNS